MFYLYSKFHFRKCQ